MYTQLAAVVALALPSHAQIATEVTRVPIRVSANGTIAATVALGADGAEQRIALWHPDGQRTLVAPGSRLEPGELAADVEAAGFDGAGTLYATLVEDMELEAGGNRTQPSLYLNGGFVALATHPCAAATADDFRPYVEQVQGDVIYMTYESPDNMEVLQGDTTSALAPYAVRLQNRSCSLLGRFSLRGVTGEYAVGFRGYLGAFIAPTDLDLERQRYVAVRLHGNALTELGGGVAIAVAPDGTAVGADAPPDLHDPACCTAHPILWRSDGARVALAPQARSGVAYAIDADDRVLGTLVGSDGRRYAFLWTSGHLQLLDELEHATSWHFEAAFAFGPHGEIIGSGTHDGEPSLFKIRK